MLHMSDMGIKEILTSTGVCVIACQKPWHADATAVPTHLKTVFSPFHNYYHPDGVSKLKEVSMRLDEIIMRLVMISTDESLPETFIPRLDSIINSLSEVIEEGDWIPCSEQLPDAPGEYLVSYHPCCWDRVGSVIKVGFDTFRGKSSWAKNKYQKVIAWRPKPYPYNGE